MANNYLTFSCTVAFPDTETRDKAQAYYDSDEFRAEHAEQTGYEPEDVSIDFDCCKEGECELWVSSGDQEYGDIEAAANFLYWVSKNLLNNARLGFQWAWTCSKLRVGEHGGGAFWTDGNDSHWLNTAQFLIDAKVVNPS